LVTSYSISKISTKLHLASKGYRGSGQNSDDFNNFSKGDSVLNYMHEMVQSHGMLKTMSSKELDGGSATESGGDILGPGENLQTVASNGGVQGRSTATRSETAARRLSRSKADALVSMATSSKSMAHSSKRRTAAIMVKELSGALASAKQANASPAVIQALENQLLDCVADCSAKPKRARGDGSESDDGTDVALAGRSGAEEDVRAGRAVGGVVGVGSVAAFGSASRAVGHGGGASGTENRAAEGLAAHTSGRGVSDVAVLEMGSVGMVGGEGEGSAGADASTVPARARDSRM